MELNFSLKWNLVNQGGRVPPGVPEQPMTNFGIGCPGTPGGTLAIENYSRNLHIRILQRTAVN